MSKKRFSLDKSGPLALCLALVVSCAPPDTATTLAVKAKLAVDPTVSALRIEVDTEDRVVTLTANVDSQAEKDRALELARETAGVRDVVDMISVRTAADRGDAPSPDRPLGERLDDASITVAVKSRLLEDPTVDGMRIDVDTRNGVVFLTGVVATEMEKERAIRLARDTQHVRDVKANLAIGRG